MERLTSMVEMRQAHLIDAETLLPFRGTIYFRQQALALWRTIEFLDNSALGYSGSKVVQQPLHALWTSAVLWNNQENCSNPEYSTLAVYYLSYHPEHGYFNQWNNSCINRTAAPQQIAPGSRVNAQNAAYKHSIARYHSWKTFRCDLDSFEVLNLSHWCSQLVLHNLGIAIVGNAAIPGHSSKTYY